MSCIETPVAQRPRRPDSPFGLGHARFNGQTTAMIHTGTCELVAYLESRRAADGRVHRAAIDPAEITPLLPNLFIAECADGGWRYRLFGTRLVERLGAEVTGRWLHQIFAPEIAERVSGLYDAAAAGRTPITRRGHFFGGDNEYRLTESTQFPIVARDGRTVQIMGGVFFFRSETGIGTAGAMLPEACEPVRRSGRPWAAAPRGYGGEPARLSAPER